MIRSFFFLITLIYDGANLRVDADVRKPAKLQIKNVISNTNGGTSENDVEFIIQVCLR